MTAPSPSSPEVLTCADCPLPYGDPGWCDAVVPDDVWLKIAPREGGGGVLCISCMARRLIAIGYNCVNTVPLMVTSGPFDQTLYSRREDSPASPPTTQDREACPHTRREWRKTKKGTRVPIYNQPMEMMAASGFFEQFARWISWCLQCERPIEWSSHRPRSMR